MPSFVDIIMMLQHPSVVVLDVRQQHEIERSGVIKGSGRWYNVPCDKRLRSCYLGDVGFIGSKSTPILVYCGTGGRANKVVKKLRSKGFTNVINGGGYDKIKEHL